MRKQTFFQMFIVITVLLAACSPVATIEPAEPVEQEPTAVPVEEPSEPEPVEIAFWYPYGEGSWTGDFLSSKIDEFNAANPDVTVVGQSYESYAAIIEGLQRAAAAGDLPGVATIGYGFDEYIVNSELATPINAVMGDEGEEFLSDFFPSLLEVTTFDGDVYGVPLALSVAEVFYHSDLFEQAGLDPNEPPETWDDFLATARTINEELGIYGVAFALDDPWIFETSVRSNGGEFLNEDGTEAMLDSDIAIATLSDWGTGVEDGSILYNADFFETLQTFGGQQVGMFAVSSYGTLIYQEIAPQVQAMPWPAAEGEVARIPAGGNSLYIFGNSEAEREGAAKFIEFIDSPEANAEWAMNSGYLPTRVSSLKAIEDFIDGFDNYRIAVSGIDNVVPPTQFGTNALQANQYIMDAIEAVMLGVSESADALAEANLKVNGLLSE